MEKILVSGKFELIHPGHLHYFKEAGKLSENSELVVLVARDKNIDHEPLLNEKERTEVLESLEMVDRTILGFEERSFKKVIEKERPDIVALGYDQNIEEELKRIMEKENLNLEIKKISAYKPERYSTSKLVNKG